MEVSGFELPIITFGLTISIVLAVELWLIEQINTNLNLIVCDKHVFNVFHDPSLTMSKVSKTSTPLVS